MAKGTETVIYIWWDEIDDCIKLRLRDTLSTVNNRPGSKRAHPNLFRKLAAILKEDGKPFPPERHGSEP